MFAIKLMSPGLLSSASIPESQALPSYMGAHGALTMKPSRVWSTGFEAQSCALSAGSNLGCLGLRIWVRKLKVAVSKEKRKVLRENSKNLKVVNKKKNSDGSWSVWGPQFFPMAMVQVKY